MSNNKGRIFEQKFSEYCHQQNLPVLISSALMRRYGGGQIDMAYIQAGELILCELKSGESQLSGQQVRRLKLSLMLVNAITDYPTRLKLIKKILPNCPSLLNL